MIKELNFENPIDLNDPISIELIKEKLKHNDKLLNLIETNISDYLQFFRGLTWNKLHPGGLIKIQIAPKQTIGYEFIILIEITNKLKKLSLFKGFKNLLSGFKNPSQVDSTIFEINIGYWCVNRKIFRDIIFSPEVNTKYGIKYPEFLWKTELGDLYCECKKVNFYRSPFIKRVQKLKEKLEYIYNNYKPWDPKYCIDVRFEGGTINNIEKKFDKLISFMSTHQKSSKDLNQLFELDDISAVFRLKGTSLPSKKSTIISASCIATSKPQNISEGSYLTLKLSLDKYYERAVKNLLCEARKQIPDSYFGAIFINSGNAVLSKNKVLSLLKGQAYSKIPWVSIWERDRFVFAAWRTNQPFDDRLLVKINNT